MNIEIIFKKIVLGYLLLLSIYLCSGFIIQDPQYHLNFYEAIDNDYQIDPYGYITIIIFLLSYVSLFNLYKFHKIGKNLFIFYLFAMYINTFLGGSYISTPIESALSTATTLLEGSILALLFFSPIKKKFN